MTDEPDIEIAGYEVKLAGNIIVVSTSTDAPSFEIKNALVRLAQVRELMDEIMWEKGTEPTRQELIDAWHELRESLPQENTQT